MSVWNLLEYAAWAVSGVIFLWMILDAVRVSRDFDEDVLLSSREGEVEFADEVAAREG
jgi:hypothetical protein